MATKMITINLKPLRGARDGSAGSFSSKDDTGHRLPHSRLAQAIQSNDRAAIASITR